jgi:hypothetical protein
VDLRAPLDAVDGMGNSSRLCICVYRATGLVLGSIHRLVCGRQKIPQRFGDWICLRPQVAQIFIMSFIVILFLSPTDETGCRLFIS